VAADVLTDEEIAELEDGVVAGLATAIGNLTVLREAGAHTRRGFDTWHAYVLDRFGDLLRHLDLPVPERRALVASMHEDGKNVREIAEKLAVTKSTAHRDLQALAEVVQLDDHRPTEQPDAAAQDAAQDVGQGSGQPVAPAPSSVDLVVTLVARARDGYTVHEAARRLRWRQGQTSCALSRAEKRGRLVRTGRFRDGCAVYTVPAAAALSA
jgi:hypothetical protein